MIFSWYIIAYLFTAGIASGAFLTAFIACMWDAHKQTPATERIVESVQPGFYLAPAFGVLAIFNLLLDLGNPNRVLPMLLNPQDSIIGIGSWLLGLFAIFTMALAITALLKPRVPSWLFWLFGIPAALLSVGVMSYTGVLLSTLVSVDFWATPWLVAVFVASSITTGLAAILLCGAVFGTRAHVSNMQTLWKALFICTIIEAVVIAIFLWLRSQGTETCIDSLHLMLFGAFAPYFWGGICLAGFLVPWAMHALERLVGTAPAVAISSSGVLMGGFFLRYCIVGAGLYSPLVLSSLSLGL